MVLCPALCLLIKIWLLEIIVNENEVDCGGQQLKRGYCEYSLKSVECVGDRHWRLIMIECFLHSTAAFPVVTIANGFCSIYIAVPRAARFSRRF